MTFNLMGITYCGNYPFKKLGMEEKHIIVEKLNVLFII